MTQVAGIKEISSVVASHLTDLDKYLKEQLKSNTTLLDTVVRYILRQRGKRARPMLVFLSAGAAGHISQRATVGAAMVELLHTATLVHDDVVDQAEERRGMASINAEWKNKIAVLVGDYFLSQGLLLAVNNSEFDFLRITSDAVKRMSEGELLQIQKSRQRSTDEATYFRIISDKTASLISTCCEVGAVSANANIEARHALREYGELVGQAFQIRDDVLDYSSRSFILGKPVGNDIIEQKITLPLIYACMAASPADGAAIIKMIKSKKPKAREVAMVVSFVDRHRGVEAAQSKANELQEAAVRLLEPLAESVFKTALIDFAKFAVERPA